MNKRTILSALLLSTIFISHQAKAQSIDSTHYDLGRTLIRKDALQHITIKGADLERMPFGTLSEAINVWLYGMYGTSTNYVPVVNGMILTNVDALSIYDIEEITAVQSAMSTVNGTGPEQVMLLIKTRQTPKGKWGIRAAGQSDVVTARKFNSLGDQYTTNSYHQYNLSAYTHGKNISAGVSANYQYDAIPEPKTSTVITYTQPNYHLYKFNAYLDATLGKSTLSVNAGYVPQTISFGQQFSTPTLFQINDINALLKNYYANLNFKSRIAKILHNTFSAGFVSYDERVNGNLLSQTGSVFYNMASTTQDKFTNYIFKDNLLLSLKAHDWTFEPSVNLFYHHGHDNYSNNYLTTNGGSSVQTGYSTYYFTVKGLQVTPSVDIRYRNVLDLQGGAVVLASDIGQAFLGNKPKRLLPYASLMVDLTRIGNDKPAVDWRIFGSFASPSGVSQDLYGASSTANETTLLNPALYFSGNDPLIQTYGYNPYQYLKQWQAGSTLSLAADKIQLSYNFNHMQYFVQQTIIVPAGGGGYTTVYAYPVNTAFLHRFGVNASIISKTSFTWRSGINVTYVKNGQVTEASASSPGTTGLINQQNDDYVTGGFTNRINAGHLLFGLDAIYLFRQPYFSNFGPLSTVNSFNIQHVYAGYQFTWIKNKPVEIYASARDAIENKQSTLNMRRLYGLGFKTSF